MSEKIYVTNHRLKRDAALKSLTEAIYRGDCNTTILELLLTAYTEAKYLDLELKDLQPLPEIKPITGLMTKEELENMLKCGPPSKKQQTNEPPR